jgi:sterol 22-desaturase
MIVFTFLFVSQDTSSGACARLLQLTADRPEILDMVRVETLRLHGGDQDKPLRLAMVDDMISTRSIIKETLRHRTPVIMVPFVAKKDYPSAKSYTIPKGKLFLFFASYIGCYDPSPPTSVFLGSMVCPAGYPALQNLEIYPNPDTFDSDR